MTQAEIDKLIKNKATKKCCSCNQVLWVNEFYVKKDKGKNKHFRFNSPCKVCAHINRNIAYQKAYQRRIKYNMTEEEYQFRLQTQNYSCAICHRHVDDCKKELFVDHCHKTGKVRGLLCNKCNSGVGFFNDDISTIKKAIQYLKNNL